MAQLYKDDYKMCQELLTKAEIYTQVGNSRIRAMTYNNYACLFRKTKKFRNALSYLERALELEYNCINFPEDNDEQDEEDLRVEQCLIISNPCEIHLNICAILSQMQKHTLALHHAMKALILIQDELGERLTSIGTEEVTHETLS
jgi:tetratricopeptide (TPR) repeat protein